MKGHKYKLSYMNHIKGKPFTMKCGNRVYSSIRRMVEKGEAEITYDERKELGIEELCYIPRYYEKAKKDIRDIEKVYHASIPDCLAVSEELFDYMVDEIVKSREALHFYANKKNHAQQESQLSRVYVDYGAKARRALGKEEPDI